jgi:DNA primase catalytic core
VSTQTETRTTERVEQLRAATSAAAELFVAAPRRYTAVTYLRQRGIDASQLGPQWLLGYAPPGWTRLVDKLRDRFDDEVLIESGLARRSSRATLIDAFRDRVILGLRSSGGTLAGFVGRDLSGDPNAPKYLNSRQSPLFDKSSLLYGLSEGLQHPTCRQPVVVEGPLDVLAIAARATNTIEGLLPVASCGTSFTKAHAQLVAEVACVYESAAVVAMDGDNAGRVASLVAGEQLRATGLDVRLASLPNGSDPAEYLARPNSTIDAFRADNGVPLVVGRLQLEIARQGDGTQWIEGRLDAMRGVAKYLATYPDAYVARQISWLSDALHLQQSTVTHELAKAMAGSRRSVQPLPPVRRLPVERSV